MNENMKCHICEQPLVLTGKGWMCVNQTCEFVGIEIHNGPMINEDDIVNN